MDEVNTLRPENRTVAIQVSMINFVGYRRSNNEDNCCINDFFIAPEQMNDNVSCTTAERGQAHVFGVFDGVGGDAHGEAASCAAASFFAAHQDALLDACAHPEEMEQLFRQANDAVCAAAEDSATTASLLCIRGATAYLANTGDSRVYFYHENLLDQISLEHTWAAQMGIDPDGPGAHAILRYLGDSDNSELCVPYCAPALPLENGDMFLLCSDGLTDMVPDEGIREILSACADPEEAASALVHAALQGGGVDNITVMVLRITLPSTPDEEA